MENLTRFVDIIRIASGLIMCGCVTYVDKYATLEENYTLI